MAVKKIEIVLWLSALSMSGQTFSQRGFLETDFWGFPQIVPTDRGHFIGDVMLRWDANYKPASWITFSGAIEAQSDTHRQTERSFRLDIDDRGLLRPMLSVRTAQVSLQRGHFTLDLGKQFIRWGKADILNPTDRFAPRDALNVVDTEFLGVLGARANFEYEGTSVDLVWTRFTPSRVPLLQDRWVNLPAGGPVSYENAATNFPGGGQYGARINHVGRGYEASVSIFDGFNHLPLLIPVGDPGVVFVRRFYPKIRSYGADAAIPLKFFTIKTEAAWIHSREETPAAPRSDGYVLWVAQVERQVKQWVLVGGYAGQTVFDARYPLTFDPERGLAKTVLLKASYNIDAPTSVSFTVAVRPDGEGAWISAEYSHLLATHWRVIGGVTAITGVQNDFLGQYRRNSFGVLRIRYSF